MALTAMDTESKKDRQRFLALTWSSSSDFIDFWQKCYPEIRQSKDGCFPAYLTNASALPSKNNENKELASCHSNAVLSALPDFNQSPVDFVSPDDL